MKSLSRYIQEKLVINSLQEKLVIKKTNQYKYFPKTKKELKDIILQRIKEEGNEVDLNDIDLSKITNMSGMFYNYKFTCDISNWDVSNVRAMSYMFEKSKFNGDLSKWDVSNVRRFTHIFMRSSFSGDISNWKINPDAKDHMQRMFTGSPLEKKPPIWYKKR